MDDFVVPEGARKQYGVKREDQIKAMQELMELSDGWDQQNFEYFSAMSEEEFMDWIDEVISDPDSRSSMMIAVLREGMRFRRGQ